MEKHKNLNKLESIDIKNIQNEDAGKTNNKNDNGNEDVLQTKRFKLDTKELKDVIKGDDLVKLNSENRLKGDFFDENCVDLSKKLLGKYLVRRHINIDKVKKKNHENLMICKIVEVEAYPGGNDSASHSFNGKQTERNRAMFMKAGTAYVYNIYGIYCCLNVSSKEPGGGVLIRALEPLIGIDIMKLNRSSKSNLKLKDLTTGPSKLCQAMNITKTLFNELDLSTCESLWIQEKIYSSKFEILDESKNIKDFEIFETKRIGIDYADEKAINALYRFYMRHSPFVSIRAKEDER